MARENKINVILITHPFPNCPSRFRRTNLKEMFRPPTRSGEALVADNALVVSRAEHEDPCTCCGFDSGFQLANVGGVGRSALDSPGHGDDVDLFVYCCSDGLLVER
jgi:hypothetical protein